MMIQIFTKMYRAYLHLMFNVDYVRVLFYFRHVFCFITLKFLKSL